MQTFGRHCQELYVTQGRTQEGGVGVNPPPLNLICDKNVITYAKEFVYVFVHFCLFDVNLTQKTQNDFA